MARVLIIDDSPTETYKLTTMLEKNGHTVFTADNGEAGIALAQEILPDLVLMDVVMPGLNGFQATRQLSKLPQTSHIPVIIVTTKDQQTDRVWGMRQGAKAYLSKPIAPDVLMATMKEVMVN
jgi:twitching motility two-component system response regulator PilH